MKHLITLFIIALALSSATAGPKDTYILLGDEAAARDLATSLNSEVKEFRRGGGPVDITDPDGEQIPERLLWAVFSDKSKSELRQAITPKIRKSIRTRDLSVKQFNRTVADNAQAIEDAKPAPTPEERSESQAIIVLDISDPLDLLMGLSNNFDRKTRTGVAFAFADTSRRIVYNGKDGTYNIQSKAGGVWSTDSSGFSILFFRKR
jgi:hypothetical protein